MFAMTTQFFKGLIAQWYGSIASIPSGWALCDGSNGTPDMRDKFVIGAGGAHAVNDTGGALTHDHYFTALDHTHPDGGAQSVMGGGAVSVWDASENSDIAVVRGDTDTADNVPPFLALAYIQRMV